MEITFSEEHRRELQQQLQGFVALSSQDERTFSASPGEHCNWCPARDIVCTEGRVWLGQQTMMTDPLGVGVYWKHG